MGNGFAWDMLRMPRPVRAGGARLTAAGKSEMVSPETCRRTAGARLTAAEWKGKVPLETCRSTAGVRLRLRHADALLGRG
eukprot:6580220-Pyramimonas_sp.AAC.1